MDHKQRLLARLESIGDTLKASGHALALLGLGSVGTELDRIDAYSDLDFFAIVKPGHKQRFLTRLDWLEASAPLVYSFQNTADGFKALYADGIFCEYAVFEPYELSNIPFAAGRLVWHDESFDTALTVPRERQRHERSREWLLGEALTNLYVGLGRVRRGEVVSGTRFIQSYAVDRVLELAAQIETAQPGDEDQFNLERRFEVRFPNVAAHLAAFMQGYDQNRASAVAILAYLDQHFAVNPGIRSAILALCT
jgi:lincosamide nucleotidyltransferase B/F